MRYPVLLLCCAASLAAQVSVREEKMAIPTWEIGPAEVHSLYWDTTRDGERNIYPYTLNDILTNNKTEKTYTGVVLENEYIKVLVMPDIGGRFHGALDKTNGYVWMYWQKTIKPGLISMTGAWISGGIEWNFPHGHRPSGFSPVDHRIVKHADGSATVWVGETEPIYRMRWLVGMTIFPGRSYVRCEYIMINPTDLRHPFQFWATAATHANEYAQAQYPGDVVTGHGKHEFWNWPINEGVDLTWWKNSPNASSYFAYNNPADWFGAYDHRAQGGMVHVADHHVMPGKKLWTWGSGPSGRIWEDILTEGGGAYFEPQAGAWSDNQPDYHWIGPHTVMRAQDYWYPVRDTRGYHNASRDFAVNTDVKDGKAFGAVYSTGVAARTRVVLKNAKSGAALADAVVTISPDKPWTFETAANGGSVYDLHLAVYDTKGKLAIEVQQRPPEKIALPAPVPDPPDPKRASQDELYAAAETASRFHRYAEAARYYEEALRRDPGDSRVNADLADLAAEQGRWEEALRRYDTALKRDPENGRLHMGRGLVLKALEKPTEAADAFFRAAYAGDSFAQSYLNLARLDLARGDDRAAAEKAAEAARLNGNFADIPALEAAALRLSGQPSQALRAAERALALDPMHFMGGREKLLAIGNSPAAAAWRATWQGFMRGAVQNYLELAAVYAQAGMYRDAGSVLAEYSEGRQDASLHPMVNYLRGWLEEKSGHSDRAREFYRRARKGPVDYTNPHRDEEAAALEAALRADPRDARASLYLGNLLYARTRRGEAVDHWRWATETEPGLVHAWRNLGYAAWHFRNDLDGALAAYEKASALNPADARVLLELDQVAELKKAPSAERLARLQSHAAAVEKNDDLSFRMIDLQLQSGQRAGVEAALTRLRTHHFHTWEGRYEIHDAWVEANQQLGDMEVAAKRYPEALRFYRQACAYPANLETAPRTPDFRAHVNWNLARLALTQGNRAEAEGYLKKILAERYRRPHLGSYYQALAMAAQGDKAGHDAMLAKLEAHAREAASNPGRAAAGRYLMALVLAERGDTAGAATERAAALSIDAKAGRAALHEAQLEYASAHQ